MSHEFYYFQAIGQAQNMDCPRFRILVKPDAYAINRQLMKNFVHEFHIQNKKNIYMCPETIWIMAERVNL
jgi:hypothetical protein